MVFDAHLCTLNESCLLKSWQNASLLSSGCQSSLSTQGESWKAPHLSEVGFTAPECRL